MQDCFSGERCTQEGFCCPLSQEKHSASALLETGESEALKATPFFEHTVSCPDGSTWLRPCNKDSDCIFSDEICAEHKCCSACNQRRRQVLDELPTNDVFGVHIPQCENNGRYYRAGQCRVGTEECWCVDQFGRAISAPHTKTRDFGRICQAMRNTVSESSWIDERELLKKLSDKIDLRRKQESINPVENHLTLLLTGIDSRSEARKTIRFEANPKQKDDKRGEKFTDIIADSISEHDFSKLGIRANQSSVINEDNSTNVCRCDDDCFGNQKYAPSTNLATCGPNERYVKCFDPCQPTCVSNSSTSCPHGECRGGCHCRDGFIRRNTDLHSPCILQSQCTLENVDVTEHCTDSLREYKACGSACPISCGNRNIPRELCNEKCISGCFCKIPYIIENDADPANSSSSSVHPHVIQCSDPLKNFQVCGSSCPAGCNNRLGGSCSGRCMAGCFCRSPYILQDANNHNSECVLPRQCSTYISSQQTCSDPRKQWISCFSLNCARSCANPTAKCSSADCTSGCTCLDPYVLLDVGDPNSRCVLPAECVSQAWCTDPLKEYQSCASSCPLGCNNRVPQTCTPCVAGCFCKAGYIFEDAINWPTSRCVHLNQCPLITNRLPTTILASITGTVISGCPITTNDVNGKMCNYDSDCQSQQKCCRSSSPTILGPLHQRCTCSDPHAIWNSCGSLCPEYCGQPSVPLCSATCNPGCHCESGYVKARNDVTAPCVAKAQCNPAGNRDDTTESTPKPSDPFDGKGLASVQISGQDGRISGRFRFFRYGDKMLRLKGTVYGMPLGEHALVIHEYGDISDACAYIGTILLLDNNRNMSAILGNVQGDGTANTEIAKIINLPDVSSIIGRSLVVHSLSVSDWTLRHSDEPPLACGIIGLTSR
uniref:Thyroglobulin type-1 domain-containing protein n=1 Tax=Ascaris lumbricoides TaxID=6252 RepID=A0A9J2Q5D4_ASCLU